MTQGPTQAGIYCIRNTVSGRCYVGSAINIRQRWYSHRSLLLKGIHHSSSLKRSWLKHGESAFVFEVLEIVSDVSIILKREQYWIDELKSADPKLGFNMSPTAGNCKGCKHSDDYRAEMSAKRRGVPKSKHGKANIVAALLVRNKSEEMRQRVRASKLKLYASPEGRKQLSEQSLRMWNDRRAAGVKWSHPQTEETRRKLSIAKKGKMTDAHKAAIALSNKLRAVFGAAIHK